MNKVQFFSVLMLLPLLSTSSAYSEEKSRRPAGIDSGSANIATITQIGEEQRAIIRQKNIHGGVLSGAIQQNGIGNNAHMSLKGGDLSGSIIQDGNDNQARLMIHGDDNNGAIEQYGDSNSAGLRIDGYGKDVTLIQQGNGHSFRGPIRVGGDTPSGLPITIRQY